MIDLGKYLKPDTRVRLNYGPNSRLNKLVHIRALVDGRIVYCWWAKHKRRWVYEIEGLWIFKMWNEEGVLLPA